MLFVASLESLFKPWYLARKALVKDLNKRAYKLDILLPQRWNLLDELA